MRSLFFRLSLLLALGSQLLAPSSQAQSYINGFPAALGQTTPALSLPVTLPNDVAITGIASATTGNNIIATDGATSTSAVGYHSGSVQIIASAGISAGAVSFEQSNDGTNFTLLPVQEQTATAQTLQTSAITIALSTSRIFHFSVNANFIRCRISTTFTGGPVQAFTSLSQLPLAAPSLTVQQATAANLAATVTYANNQVVGLTSSTSAGGSTTWTTYVSAATNNLTQVVSGVSVMTGLEITNTTAAIKYVKFWNLLSASVTMGTTAAHFQFAIQPNSSRYIQFIPCIRAATGLTFAITGGSSLTDNTAVAAGDVVMSIMR